jgi:hypothetical protein
MTLILSGTDGLSDVDGSAATPAIRGTDANTGIFFGADIIGFAEGGAEVARFNADAQFVAAAGTASLPVITTTGDVNTGIFFPAADTIAFSEGGAEAMRIDASGNLRLGTTGSSDARLYVRGAGTTSATASFEAANSSGATRLFVQDDGTTRFFGSAGSETARITSSGEFLVGKTASDVGTVGTRITSSGTLVASTSSEVGLFVNRNTTDGTLVSFRQDNSDEGNISVSGTTVSYNGGHLSRWAQTTTAKDDSLVKGTVLSNLDAMNVYTNDEGNPVDNEQLNKVKVSDVEGDANVAGVFVNWTYDDAHNVDEINMAMTGDMIIRIAQGVTVARGDLLMSAGDGTAKPQGDDIVRSKTIAKVTSTHVTCTYADGSFCVPCVLMAC